MPYKALTADLSQMIELQTNWNTIVYAMQRPSVFCTWEWMNAWWKHYGNSYEPLVLAFEDDNGIAGILPLAKKNMLIEDGVFSSRVLTYWGSIDLHTDHLDVIAPDGNANACLRHALSFLKNEYTQWDVLHLSHVDEDSALFSDLAHNPVFDSDSWQVSVAPYIDVAGEHQYSIDEYMKSLRSKRRLDVRRRTKKLFNENNVSYGYPAGMEAGDAVATLFELHNRRAEKKRIKTSFSGNKLRNFHAEIADVFSEKQWLWLRFLCNGGDPLAAVYAFSFADRLFGYQMGFDPDWESKGVGSVLFLETIKEAFEQRIKEYDFLRGGEGYKNTWTKTFRNQYNINIYNNTLRGTAFKKSFRARAGLKKFISHFQKNKT